MTKANWRGRDLGWYLCFVSLTATFVSLDVYGPAVFAGFFALLQLVETVVHAFADTCAKLKIDPS